MLTDEEGVLLEPGVNGGMYKKEIMCQKPTNWISVSNIDDYMCKLEVLGGKITIEKIKIKGVG